MPDHRLLEQTVAENQAMKRRDGRHAGDDEPAPVPAGTRGRPGSPSRRPRTWSPAGRRSSPRAGAGRRPARAAAGGSAGRRAARCRPRPRRSSRRHGPGLQLRVSEAVEDWATMPIPDLIKSIQTLTSQLYEQIKTTTMRAPTSGRSGRIGRRCRLTCRSPRRTASASGRATCSTARGSSRGLLEAMKAKQESMLSSGTGAPGVRKSGDGIHSRGRGGDPGTACPGSQRVPDLPGR